jgi:hypothetical protein
MRGVSTKRSTGCELHLRTGRATAAEGSDVTTLLDSDGDVGKSGTVILGAASLAAVASLAGSLLVVVDASEDVTCGGCGCSTARTGRLVAGAWACEASVRRDVAFLVVVVRPPKMLRPKFPTWSISEPDRWPVDEYEPS